jgi:membrane fusion protein, heavy metal efflux system
MRRVPLMPPVVPMTARPFALSLAFVLLLTGCSDHPNEPPKGPPPPVARVTGSLEDHLVQLPSSARDRVQIETVALRPMDQVITAPGEVLPDLKRVAKVTSRMEGQVVRMHAGLGDRVRVNQPLVAIESMRLDELVQEYLVTRAQAEVAENNYRRTQTLRAEEIVPERRLIEERGRHLESSARHQHVREKLLHMGLTEAELRALVHGSHMEGHQARLTAPLPGVVVAQQVVLGQGVSPGDTLFEIMDTSRVWVVASFPIEVARQFQPGETGTIKLAQGEPLVAPITYIAPDADEKTRTTRVRLEAPNPTDQLRPHEYVEVSVSRRSAPTLAVPNAAVTFIGEVRGVFIQREHGYAFVPVEIGREGQGWIEILKGLTVGDRAVTQGVFDLKNVLLRDTIEKAAN